MFFYLKLLFHIFLISALTVLQYSFIETLPFWAGNANILIVALIFVISLRGLNYALFWGGVAGMLLDFYSFLPFGVFIVLFISLSVFIYLLSDRVFTNRSLYSFWALTFFATIFCRFLFEFLRYSSKSLVSQTELLLLHNDFWISLGEAIAVNLILMLVLFYIFNFVSNRFRPVFIRG